MKTKSGFTLVEILIVVVILGILAAIVIPQFTEASTEAKTSSLMSNLQTARSQIELYKIQHNDALPTTGGLAFEVAMTGKTNIDGEAWTIGTAYGPYLQQMPKNPFNDLNSVTGGTAAPPGDNSSGWYFNTSTGAFNANDTADHALL